MLIFVPRRVGEGLEVAVHFVVAKEITYLNVCRVIRPSKNPTDTPDLLWFRYVTRATELFWALELVDERNVS